MMDWTVCSPTGGARSPKSTLRAGACCGVAARCGSLARLPSAGCHCVGFHSELSSDGPRLRSGVAQEMGLPGAHGGRMRFTETCVREWRPPRPTFRGASARRKALPTTGRWGSRHGDIRTQQASKRLPQRPVSPPVRTMKRIDSPRSTSKQTPLVSTLMRTSGLSE